MWDFVAVAVKMGSQYYKGKNIEERAEHINKVCCQENPVGKPSVIESRDTKVFVLAIIFFFISLCSKATFNSKSKKV